MTYSILLKGSLFTIPKLTKKIPPSDYYMVRFIEPFLPHCNSSSLNAFHVYLQNYQNSIYAMPSAIHNIVNECHTNERLLQVVQLLVEKF